MSDKALILIVDDSPTNLQVLAACVKDDHRIKVATNGLQCLQIAQAEPKPDLILLDVEMPGMNGYEVCQKLKSSDDTADIPVIFVTGLLGDKDEEKGLLLGAVDYITKPIRPAIVIARVKTHITLKLQRDKLNKMAFFDQLTGLYNRHYLIDMATKKVARALRHKYNLWVLMIDIDHFKNINDTHGHPMGDEILKLVASTLVSDNRSEDIAARFGGEEFVVMFDPCDLKNALVKAERIRTKIEQLNPHGIGVTVSIGMAKLVAEDATFERLLKRADEALYAAKENGRNRIEMSS
ncbi:GGDEF domain-containing response regulator [Psychromonas sp. Urea-02u-13]|uniref:GGDEF domain-containing response regulator n=1 Tax=Psychromonas sp. Urea-02u-13 TaxID=2058326 RepID=UPI000C339337|nr:diguanylate cyclase [Psychromonas sp. Urea-02u-13]PKG38384.1 diguanylate cyclase response regulator [Psychromonas sp. Urea-02u-13]